MFLVVVLALLAVTFLLLWIRKEFAPERSSLPGPKFDKIRGHLKLVQEHAHRIHDWFLECAETYGRKGVFYISLPGKPLELFLTDPELIHHVLGDHFDYYKRSDGPQKEMIDELFGNGIFGSDGEQWKIQRKLYSYMFSQKMMRGSMFNSFDECSKKLLSKIDGYAETGEKFDIQDLFARTTLDSVCKIAFGKDAGCLDAEVAPPISRAFDLIMENISARGSDMFWKAKRFLNIGKERVISENLKILNTFFEEIVQNAKNAEYNEQKTETNKFNILSLFLDKRKSLDIEITDDFLRDVAVTICNGGRDTTACVMTWCIYELAKNPNTLKRLRGEIDSTGDITFDVITKELPFTEAVFFETLRLWPSIPQDCRICYKPDVLPNGVKVAPSTMCNFTPYTIGRLKKIWGEDANEFRPERYLEPETAKKFANHGTFPHFGVGSRLCLGKHMAIMEAKKILPEILRMYDFEIIPTDEPLTYLMSFILWIKGGLYVTAKRRKS